MVKFENNLAEVVQGDLINKMLKQIRRDMRFPTMWYVQPAKAQTSLRILAV